MQFKTSKKSFIIKTEKNGDINLPLPEYARWLCLIEAIELISNKAVQMKQDLNNNDWIKPLALHKYVEERFESMQGEILMSENNDTEINVIIDNKVCTTSQEPALL